MIQVKVSQLIAAAGIAIVCVVGLAGTADAAPAAGTSTVECVNGDGESANDAEVGALISCDTPACVSGALSIVTDEDGVQHQACVDSAAAAPPVGPAAPAATASLLTQPTPATSTSQLPKTGLATGGLIIAAILVSSGCVASLVSRRKTSSRHRL